MNRLAFAVLAVALASCGRSVPAAGPTADELGIEAATFPQVLVPLSTQTLAGFEEAAARLGDSSGVTAADFKQTFELESFAMNGQATSVMIAYTNPWLAPAQVLHRPMTVPQFLRACESEGRDAVLVAPKGQIYIPRAQMPDVRAKIILLGASDKDLPLLFIHGSLR
jgi:hypothetical protein